MEKNNKVLALFDFDGTITRKDSLLYFLIYTHKWKAIPLLLWFSPIHLLYKLGVCSNEWAKEHLFGLFYKDCPESRYQEWVEGYTHNVLSRLATIKAVERIKWHQKEGHEVCVVSATMEDILRPWCKEHKLQLIGTRVIIEKDGSQGSLLPLIAMVPKRKDEFGSSLIWEITGIFTPMAIAGETEKCASCPQSLLQALPLGHREQVPQNLPRFYEVMRDDELVFLPIEELIREYIHLLYRNVEVISVDLFRVTRNGDYTLDESEDVEAKFLDELKRKLKSRRTGRVVRIELELISV